jgi:hypothetical protein
MTLLLLLDLQSEMGSLIPTVGMFVLRHLSPIFGMMMSRS